MDCENNCVVFRSVSAYNTSITCSNCGHTDKRNRTSQEIFMCLRCGHTDEADVNAAINIRDRFLTGKYGSGFQPLDKIESLEIKIL
jgi:transposase